MTDEAVPPSSPPLALTGPVGVWCVDEPSMRTQRVAGWELKRRRKTGVGRGGVGVGVGCSRVGMRGGLSDILRSRGHLPFMVLVCPEYNLFFPILGNSPYVGLTGGGRPLSPVREGSAQLSQCLGA